MSIPSKLRSLVGAWSGRNILHMAWQPENPLHESKGVAAVSERVGGQFLEIAYTWVYDDKPREGVIILGGDNKTAAVNAFWTDSWHLAHQVMICEGKECEDGSVSVQGSYKVEGHPDWGWRTEIIPNGDSFQYKMYNVSPEGEEDLAVEMEMRRT